MGLRIKNGRSERLRILIGSIDDHFGAGENDSIQLKTWSGRAIIETIADCFHCPGDITSNELTRIIRDACFRTLRNGERGIDDFITQANSALGEWQSKPTEKYTLWTRLNYKPGRTLRVRLRSEEFIVCDNLPRTLQRNWTDPSSLNHEIVPDIEGGIVYVSGQFRNETSAGFRLSQLIDEFIGLLNLEFNRKVLVIFPETNRALFKTGPLSYMKLPTGLYSGSVWINTSYCKSSPHNSKDKEVNFLKGIEKIRDIHKKYERNPLTDVGIRCASLLDSYYNSRSNTDKLMLVWSCFEHVFSNQSDGTRGTYEAIARRAAKFDENPKTRESILLTLAGRRNLAAHSHEATGSCHVAQEVAAETASYMTWILNWLFVRGSIFSSRRDFLEWVDIPKEREALLKRLKLHNLALTYWHPRQQDQQP